MKRFTALLISLILSPVSNAADDLGYEAQYAGTQLYIDCSNAIKFSDPAALVDMKVENLVGAQKCMYTIRGMITAARGINSNAKQFGYSKHTLYCVPLEVSNLQAIKVVLKYLDDNPQYMHHASAGIIFSALRLAFPCN